MIVHTMRYAHDAATPGHKAQWERVLELTHRVTDDEIGSLVAFLDDRFVGFLLRPQQIFPRDTEPQNQRAGDKY